jgi:hypothetical protein
LYAASDKPVERRHFFGWYNREAMRCGALPKFEARSGLMAKGKTAATGKAATEHDPLRGHFARSFKNRLDLIAPKREAVVAVAGRTLLRVFPILVGDPAGGDATSRELVAASWECLRLAAEASRSVKPDGALVAEAKALVARFRELTELYQKKKTSASWSAWSVGTVASRVKDCVWARDVHYLAGQAASEALDALWQSAGDNGDAAQESSRLRAALGDDLDSLLARAAGEGPAFGPLWPQAFGVWPPWYRSYREWVGHLTSRPDWLTVVAMLDKDAAPGPTDPALQEAFDAFDGAKLPRPPLTNLTGLTPPEGLEVLRTLLKYLDCMGDPAANVVRLVLSELRTRSFQTLEETREFFAAAQSILDRTGFAVLCPSCSEIGKLDVAASKQLPTGAIRVKHGRMSTHGGGSTIIDYDLERVTEHPSG